MKMRLTQLIVTLLVAVFALTASAQKQQAGDGKHMGMHEGMHGDMHKPMDPAKMEEMRKNMAAGRAEMHSIMLDQIALIKEMAMTDGQKKKATELEKRIKAHIDSMDKMRMDHKMGMGK